MSFIEHLRPELARRVVREASAVEAKFPRRFKLKMDKARRPLWQGTVPVEGNDIAVSVTYPTGYPGVPPILTTPLSLPADCPHLLARNSREATLCWVAPGNKRRRARWNPQLHTAATAMRASQRWFLAFLVWQATRNWPVPDAWDVD